MQQGSTINSLFNGGSRLNDMVDTISRFISNPFTDSTNFFRSQVAKPRVDCLVLADWESGSPLPTPSESNSIILRNNNSNFIVATPVNETDILISEYSSNSNTPISSNVYEVVRWVQLTGYERSNFRRYPILGISTYLSNSLTSRCCASS